MSASGFGLGQEAASLALGFLGAEDIEYSENENQYIVKYGMKKVNSLSCKACMTRLWTH